MNITVPDLVVLKPFHKKYPSIEVRSQTWLIVDNEVRIVIKIRIPIRTDLF